MKKKMVHTFQVLSRHLYRYSSKTLCNPGSRASGSFQFLFPRSFSDAVPNKSDKSKPSFEFLTVPQFFEAVAPELHKEGVDMPLVDKIRSLDHNKLVEIFEKAKSLKPSRITVIIDVLQQLNSITQPPKTWRILPSKIAGDILLVVMDYKEKNPTGVRSHLHTSKFCSIV